MDCPKLYSDLFEKSYSNLVLMERKHYSKNHPSYHQNYYHYDHLEKMGESADNSLLQERAALVMALEYFSELGMEGGIIRCGGQVLAFTLGRLLTPTVFDVNFERAMPDFQGAFPVINQEFSKWVREAYPQVKYIDREEDLGQPGLRKAKMSYGPDILMKNACVVISPEKA